MAKFEAVILTAFIAVSLFTENLAVPVPELSVKLLCELLCEHCNGVSNMESGNCNCEVPEAHFKDNSACLERVQISAAEMNLKLTHTAPKSNRRRKRCIGENLKSVKSSATQIPMIYNQLRIPKFQMIPTSVSSGAVTDLTAMSQLSHLNQVDETAQRNQMGLDLTKASTHDLTRPSFDQFWFNKIYSAMSTSKIHSDSERQSPKLEFQSLRENTSEISHINTDKTTLSREIVDSKKEHHSTGAGTNSDKADILSKLSENQNDCDYYSIDEKLRNNVPPPIQNLMSNDYETNIFKIGQRNHKMFMNHLNSLFSNKLAEAEFKSPSPLTLHGAKSANADKGITHSNFLNKMNSLKIGTQPNLVNFDLLKVSSFPVQSKLYLPSKELLDLHKMKENNFKITPGVRHEYPEIHLPFLFPVFGNKNSFKSPMHTLQHNREGDFDLLKSFPKSTLSQRLNPSQNTLISELIINSVPNRMNLWPDKTLGLKFLNKINDYHLNLKTIPLQNSYVNPFLRNNLQSRIPVINIDSSSPLISRDLPSIHSKSQNVPDICGQKSDETSIIEPQKSFIKPRKSKQKDSAKQALVHREDKISDSSLGVTSVYYSSTINDRDERASSTTIDDSLVLTTLPVKPATKHTKGDTMKADHSDISSSVTKLPKKTSDYENKFTFALYSELSDTNVQVTTENPTRGTIVQTENNFKQYIEQFSKQSDKELSRLVPTVPNIHTSSENTVQTDPFLYDSTTSTPSTFHDDSVFNNLFYHPEIDVSQNPLHQLQSDDSQNILKQPSLNNSLNTTYQLHFDGLQNPVDEIHFDNFLSSHQNHFNRSRRPFHQIHFKGPKTSPYDPNFDISQINHHQPQYYIPHSSPHYSRHESTFETSQNPFHQPYFDSPQQPYHYSHLKGHPINRFQSYMTNYFPPMYGPNIPGKNIFLPSPLKAYPFVVYPTSYNNEMQIPDFPVLSFQNEILNTKQDSVLNSPSHFIPHWTKPFDQSGRLTRPIDGDLVRLSAGQTGIIMSAIVPRELLTPYSQSQHTSSEPVTFLMKPFPFSNKNIPFPDFLYQLRNGNAIVQIQPIKLNEFGKSDRE